MFEMACPARMTADSAASTYDRSLGCSRSSQVWLRKIRSGASLRMPSNHGSGSAGFDRVIKQCQAVEIVRRVAAIRAGGPHKIWEPRRLYMRLSEYAADPRQRQR